MCQVGLKLKFTPVPSHLATNHKVMSTRGPQFASPSLADDTVLIPSNDLTAAHLVVFALHALLLFTLYFTQKYCSDFRQVSSFLWLSTMVAMTLSLWALIPHSISKDVVQPGLALTNLAYTVDKRFVLAYPVNAPPPNSHAHG